MMRSIACFVFILTNSVLAQAAEDNGAVHLMAQKWVTTHAGEVEVDGLPVVANLDESTLNLDVPAVQAAIDARVPSLLPVIRKSYRLNLIVSHNPRIQIAYPVQARTISVDGALKNAFVSDLDPSKDFHFVITTDIDGGLHVQYTRKVTDGQLNGDFVLAPVPHILGR